MSVFCDVTISTQTMYARPLSLIIVFVFSVIPFVAAAFPFGGRITVHHICYNETIFARLSPPVPGDYVWTRATKTYQFGPPRNVGQWLLGLTGIPYDCLWSVSPIYVQPAISIMMMGSSGSAAPSYSAPSLQAQGLGYSSNTSSGSPTTGGAASGSGVSTPSSAKLVISEVYYDVDWSHGADPENEWIELYNGSSVTVDISGWIIQNAGGSDTLPSGTTIAPGKYLLIVAQESTKTSWSFPSDVKVVVLGSSIGNGLSNSGDIVRIRSAATASPADAVSWGTNTNAFSPAVPVVADGHSLARNVLTKDTDSAADWVDRTTPTPGK